MPVPHPTLSIVTVVKDDLPGLLKTQSSLVGQTSQNFEWVIVDGSGASAEPGSATDHLSIPNNYLWLAPTGIYPAMNTGLNRALGDYVWFINAGDLVADEFTVEELLKVLNKHRPSWLVGQVEFTHPDGSTVTPPPFDYQAEKKRLFARGRFPPHQGTIARKSLLRELDGFNEDFHIAADYEMALRLSLIADPIVLPENLARFSVGGVSSSNWTRSLKEFRSARHSVFDIRGARRLHEAVDSFKVYASMFMARLLRRA